MTFPEKYRAMLLTCLDGEEELNQRTGIRIRALPAGASFTVNLAAGLPTIGLRRTRPHVAAAEAAWCLLGHPHADWLRKYTKIWDQFCDVADCAECDGTGFLSGRDNPRDCENCNGSGRTFWLREAYGNRWRNTFGVDQLAVGLMRLADDSSDRRVWISNWDPENDIVPSNQKTVPCPVGFTLSVLGGKLNSSMMIRSSDLWHGLPGDVMRHSFVVAACAATLGVKPGIIRFTLAHPHLYERQWEIAGVAVRQPIVAPDMPLPTWTVKQVMDQPDGYVQFIRNVAGQLAWPAFDPRSEVAK